VPVTMRDVARKAGVSVKTVSRVVNDQSEVAEETRQRVLGAIDELGYRPSKLARALVTQHTDTVGLILGDITNPFFLEFSRGVMDVAQAHGYSVFVCNSDGKQPTQTLALNTLVDHAVDGIIIFPAYESEDAMKAFANHYQPVVVVGRFFEHPGIGLVLMKSYQGARLAVDYLVSRGHTAIGMIAGSATPLSLMQRVEGFRDGLKDCGLPVVDEWILPGDPVLEHGVKAARQLLTEHPQVTAIFAYNDLLALGAIQACKKLGRRVPDDCAIVGFDDIQFASMVSPALTTVYVDKYKLGQQSMIRLLEMLEDPGNSFDPIYVDVVLMVRESA
jgi:LacI family transcriptional regulator